MRDIDRRLFDAAKQGAADQVASLLAEGADAKAADFGGVTALMFATLKDQPACVRVLLPSSDPKAVDGERCSALIYACQHMRLECAKLLAADSDMRQRDFEGRCATDHAEGWGDAEMLTFLAACSLAQCEARELARQTFAAGANATTPRL